MFFLRSVSFCLVAGWATLQPAFVASGQMLDQPNGRAIAERADRYMDDRVAKDHFSGSVLVAQNGHVLFEKAYGMGNREWNANNTPETVFRIASITKQFTAAAVLLLQQRTQLNVQDPVRQYLTKLPEEWAAVSIHHLLTHTSGIPNYLDSPDFDEVSRTNPTPIQILDLVRNKPLLFRPGTKWGYSNTNYLLLALLIEKVSRRTYSDFLSQEILVPLHLSRTGVDQPEPIVERRASPYSYRNGTWANVAELSGAVLPGSGSLHSTVEDLLAWDIAIQGDKLLTPASRAAMFATYPETGVNGEFEGYGVIIAEDADQPVWITTGNISGFSSAAFDYPKSKLCVVVLSNLDKAPAVSIGSGLAALVLRP